MSLFTNILKIYFLLIVVSLSTSVITNIGLQNTSPNQTNSSLTIVNEYANNVLATLLMPVYIPYRIACYIYNNFDMIVQKLQAFIKYIFKDIIYELLKYIYLNFVIPVWELMVKCIEYVIDNCVIPFIRFILDVIYKLLEWLDYFYHNFIMPIWKTIINAIIDLIEWICNHLVIPVLRMIVNAFIETGCQVLNLLRWGWDMFLYYLVYPVIDLMRYMYNFSTGILISVWNSIIVTLWNIWNSLTVTLISVYNNITMSIIQCWDKLMNMF